MKTFIASIVLILSLFSQTTEFGLRGSLNFASYTGSDFESMGVRNGISLGGFITYELSEKVILQLEAIYSKRGAQGDGPAETEQGAPADGEAIDRLTYIDFPLTILYRSSSNMFFTFGPYLAILLDGEREWTLRTGGNVLNQTLDVKADNLVETSEIGAVFGLLFKLGKLDLSTRFMLGFTSISSFDGDPKDLSSTNLQISLGYQF